jgi:putative endonuclease
MNKSLVIVESPTKVPILPKFYCYVLKSLKNNDYYIGSTKDYGKRLKQHNSWLVRSTKYGIPWKLVYYESFRTLKEARKRELQIKRWKSRKAIERLLKSKI